MDHSTELATLNAEKDTFFDLLLTHSMPKRRRNRHELGRRNFTIFCMHYGLTHEEKIYTQAEIAEIVKISAPSVATVIKSCWDQLAKAEAPFTRVNLLEKIRRINELAGK